MFVPITKEIFRWNVTDPEYGEQMVGHLLVKNDSVVLIDPPAVEHLAEYVKVLGNPEAVILTTYHHKRGCIMMSGVLDVPLYIPDITKDGGEFSEESIKTMGLSGGRKYDENTILPLGIKAVHIEAKKLSGETAIDEMALRFGSFLIVGDSAWGNRGKLNIFPTGIMDDIERVKAIEKSLKEVVTETNSSGLLSGHGEDIRTGLSELF